MKNLKEIAEKMSYRWYCYKERNNQHYLFINFQNLHICYNDEVVTFFNGEDYFQPASQLVIFSKEISFSSISPIDNGVDQITISLKNGDEIILYAYK